MGVCLDENPLSFIESAFCLHTDGPEKRRRFKNGSKQERRLRLVPLVTESPPSASSGDSGVSFRSEIVRLLNNCNWQCNSVDSRQDIVAQSAGEAQVFLRIVAFVRFPHARVFAGRRLREILNMMTRVVRCCESTSLHIIQHFHANFDGAFSMYHSEFNLNFLFL